MAYESFGRFFDGLMENAQYEKRAEYYHKLLVDNEIESGILLDLGCGTGTMCLEMANRGYEVIGIDSSVTMLVQATEKTAGKDILLLNQDMTELDLYGTVDCAICTLDGINHLPDKESVQRTFDRVSLFMNPGGIFAFDVNTVYKHREVLGDNCFVLENENVFCTWQNSLNEDNSIEITLDFFEEEEGIYYRETESFTERAYEIGELTQMLEKSGFEILSIFEDMTTIPLSPKSEKAIMICKKR